MGSSLIRQDSVIPRSYKVMFVMLCALLTGFLWRLRGDHGWGGTAGMTAVAVGLVLSTAAFMPYRKKANPEILLAAILMTAVTNSGWGTLNSQMTGWLVSGTDAPSAFISPYSGIAVMFLLGFAWMPFFGLFLGYYLSSAKPKAYHFIIAIAVYYAVEYLCKATVAHLVVRFISPDAVSLFADTLQGAGIGTSPYGAYMAHFNDIAWAKKLAFGRNYFQTVETVSLVFSAISVILYTLFAVKDKTSAKIQACVGIGTGASITLADLFIFIADGGVRGSLRHIPAGLSGWSNWEYWTGFFTGLFIGTIILLCISHEPSAEAMTPPTVLPDRKLLRLIRNYALLCYPVISSTAIPLAQRLTYKNDFFFRSVTFSDEDVLILPFAVGAALLLIYPAVRLTRREEAVGEGVVFELAGKCLVTVFALYAFVYFFTGNAYIPNKEHTDIDITMYVSAVLIAVLLAAMTRQAGKQKPSAGDR